MDIALIITEELKCRKEQVDAAIDDLLAQKGSSLTIVNVHPDVTTND